MRGSWLPRRCRRGQAPNRSRNAAGSAGPRCCAARAGAASRARKAPIAGAQVIQVSNNPYRLSSLSGFGSRPSLNAGALGVATVTINRPIDVNRLVALEAAGRPERYEGWRRWTTDELEVRRAGPIGRCNRRRSGHMGASAPLHDSAGRTSDPHRSRATRSLAGLLLGTGRSLHARRPRARRAWSAERYRGHHPDGRGRVKTPANPDDPNEDTEPSRGSNRMGHRLVEEAHALDQAVYNAVANTPTPTLDVPFTWISNAANYGQLWVVIAAGIAVAGGPRGRRAAIRALSVLSATSVTANVAVKQIIPRRRPKRLTGTPTREARMPTSSSFPSGHTASAFGFAARSPPTFPCWRLLSSDWRHSSATAGSTPACTTPPM